MIIVTQVAREQPDDQLHINSRVFAPGLGIVEDPVVSTFSKKKKRIYPYLEIADWICPCLSYWVLRKFTVGC